MLHSAEESILGINACFLILFCPPFRKKKKTNKVWLFEKGKLGGELRGLTLTPH